MARRSIGVVLIVALLGWTVSVNQPLSACTGLHSRAAALVPAGTPPAPKPEPSPSHHNCCPPVSQTSETSAAAPHCSSGLQISANHDCCSVSHSLPATLRHFILRTTKLATALAPLPQSSVVLLSASVPSVSLENSPSPSRPGSYTVSRN